MGEVSADHTAAPATHEPKRERGRLRVETIAIGAAKVFAEKGFDAATMTEIAARSQTAIGSLYRFFPTKESLGTFMIARCLDRIDFGLAAIAERAGGLSAVTLADELIDFKLTLETHQDGAIAFAEAKGILAKSRERVTATMHNKIASLLVATAEKLPQASAQTISAIVVQILQTMVAVEKEPAPERERLVGEIRELLRFYLSSRLEGFIVPGGRRR